MPDVLLADPAAVSEIDEQTYTDKMSFKTTFEENRKKVLEALGVKKAGGKELGDLMNQQSVDSSKFSKTIARSTVSIRCRRTRLQSPKPSAVSSLTTWRD